MCMKRIDALLYEGQIEFLKGLPGTLSEHLRIAVARYQDQIESKRVSASASQNRGEQNE